MLTRYYHKAAKIRQDLQNQQAWLQGAYVYEAIADIAPVLRAFAKKGTKPRPYRDVPYPLQGENRESAKQERQDAPVSDGKAYMEMFATAFNQKFLADQAGGEK